MINIGILLDVCGISYSDSQLTKLEKLMSNLIQKYRGENQENINIGILLDVCGLVHSDDKLMKLEKLIGGLIQKYNIVNEKKSSHQTNGIKNQESLDDISKVENDTKNEKQKKDLVCFDCSLYYVSESNFKRHIDMYHENKKPFKHDLTQKHNTVDENNSIKKLSNEPTSVKENGVLEKQMIEQLHFIKNNNDESYEKKKQKEEDFNGKSSYVEENQKIYQNNFEIVLPSNDTKKEKEKQKPSVTDALFECFDCDNFFTQELDLKKHVEKFHKCKMRYMCSFCNIEFSLKESQTEHMRTIHGGPNPLQCEIWGQIGPNPLQCKICDEIMSSSQNLRLHIRKLHQIKKKFQCSICETKFTSREDLQIHEKSKHKKCEFTQKYNLADENHTFDQTNNDENQNSFDHPSKPENDMENEEQVKDLICVECNLFYVSVNNFKKHMYVFHDGKKPFACSICGRGHSNKVNLKKHIEFKHKSIQCEKCGKIYNSKHSLEMHEKDVHSKSFICEHCSKFFGSQEKLRYHIRLSHGNKARTVESPLY